MESGPKPGGWRRRLKTWTRRTLVAGTLGFLAFWWLVPVVQFGDPLSTVILDRNGELLASCRKPGRLNRIVQ